MERTSEPVITSIQRFSLDDGPGIRTTVFFKGCNLNCLWCHNPECIAAVPQVQFHADKCILCGRCAAFCPRGVHSFIETRHMLAREKCIQCGRCTASCPREALDMTGRTVPVSELMEQLRKDRDYYVRSGGGVTVSGGEPMLQPEALCALLEACREAGFQTAVDTAGNVPYAAFARVLPRTDLFLYDIKAMDEKIHRDATGVSNALILENLRRLHQDGARLIIRVPVIPGINDTVSEWERMAAFLEEIRPECVQLLPYHNYGLGKRGLLGYGNRLGDVQPPAEETLRAAQKIFADRGLDATIR